MRQSVYTRPDKPTFKPIRRRDRVEVTAPEIITPVTVHTSTQCHVTPPEIAAEMVSYLDAPGDAMVLEPSAGTGSLIKALQETGHNRITAVEQSYDLCQTLQEHVQPVNACFLDWSKSAVMFSHIIMNPPFKGVKKHLDSAMSLLANNGKIVALVPITYQNERATTIRELSPDTFSTVRVNTKLIEVIAIE